MDPESSDGIFLVINIFQRVSWTSLEKRMDQEGSISDFLRKPYNSHLWFSGEGGPDPLSPSLDPLYVHASTVGKTNSDR